VPCFSIQTTTTITDKAAVLASASRLVAQHLGKPESYVMVQLSDSCDMLFAGSSAPLACLQLKSLGLVPDQTEALSTALCDWVTDTLGITADRVYIEFIAPERAMWGWNRSTFGS